MLDILTDLVTRTRQTGTTTALVAALVANPNAILFVRSDREKQLLRSEYPALKDRVLTFTYSNLCGREFDGPLLFDKETVLAIAHASYETGKFEATLADREKLFSQITELMDSLRKL